MVQAWRGGKLKWKGSNDPVIFQDQPHVRGWWVSFSPAFLATHETDPSPHIDFIHHAVLLTP